MSFDNGLSIGFIVLIVIAILLWLKALKDITLLDQIRIIKLLLIIINYSDNSSTFFGSYI